MANAAGHSAQKTVPGRFEEDRALPTDLLGVPHVRAPKILYYLDGKALATGNSGGITPALLGHFFKNCIAGAQKRKTERKLKENWKK